MSCLISKYNFWSFLSVFPCPPFGGYATRTPRLFLILWCSNLCFNCLTEIKLNLIYYPTIFSCESILWKKCILPLHPRHIEVYFTSLRQKEVYFTSPRHKEVYFNLTTTQRSVLYLTTTQRSVFNLITAQRSVFYITKI